MISFTRYLNEGLIKLPEKMFKEGESKIVSDISSFFVTTLDKVDNAEVQRFVAHVKEVAKKYNAPIRFLKKKTLSKYKIKVDHNDLPARYKKNWDRKDPTIDLHLDWKHKGRLTNADAAGTYNDSQRKIVIGISSLTDMSFDLEAYTKKENKHIYRELIDIFDPRLERILTTYEHEFTHYVQYRALNDPMNDRFADDKAISGTQKDEYYNSKLEFDPQIKSALGEYRKYEKDNIDSKIDGNRRQWVEYFVGSKALTKFNKFLDIDEKGGFVKLSKFFESLKKHSPDKWKKAIKLFTQELEKRYPR